MIRVSLALCFVATLGCGVAAFECEADLQCGAEGSCQPTGFCSFPDEACPSGMRYGAHAAADLAGGCVDVQPGSTGSADPTMGTPGDEGEASDPGNGSSESGRLDPPLRADVGTAVPADWWNAAWAVRHRIEVRSSGATNEPLVDFPVLVHLAPEEADLARSQPAGQDARIVANVGTNAPTVLPRDIETWGPEDGCTLWVLLPEYPAAGEVVTLDFYYGNPGAAATNDDGAVWREHAAVWHGADGTDASPSAMDLALTEVEVVAGAVGPGLRFDPEARSVASAGAPGVLNGFFTPGASVSFWMIANSLGGGGFGRIFDRSTSTDAQSGWSVYTSSAVEDGLVLQHEDDGPGLWRFDLAQGAVPLGEWHYVTISYAEGPSPPVIFVDGEQGEVVQAAAPDMAVGLATSEGVELRVGQRSGAADRTFDGVLDELRISPVVRDYAWHLEQRHSMLGNAATVTPAEYIDDVAQPG